MSKSSQFIVPEQNSDSNNFKLSTTLPEHLDQYSKISKDLREQMSPVMKTLLELTDMTALRSAALPHSN